MADGRLVRIRPDDDDYPIRLLNLDAKPTLTTSGPLDHRGPAVAIVGSRNPLDEAREFAQKLAFDLAKQRVLIVSGGAVGIDTAAHEGALDAGGTTWCVAPNGRRHSYPEENGALFRRIEASPGSRMIWPFADDQPKTTETPKERNAVLVGLARAVVVVQANYKSGSRNAARHARKLKRPVFVVPAAPWMRGFVGSLYELVKLGGLMLAHPSQLFLYLNVPAPADDEHWPWPTPVNLHAPEEPETEAPAGSFDEHEKIIISALSGTPQHIDGVIARTGLPTSTTITALLTLSLRDVVVEGPDGFYRRK